MELLCRLRVDGKGVLCRCSWDFGCAKELKKELLTIRGSAGCARRAGLVPSTAAHPHSNRTPSPPTCAPCTRARTPMFHPGLLPTPRRSYIEASVSASRWLRLVQFCEGGASKETKIELPYGDHAHQHLVQAAVDELTCVGGAAGCPSTGASGLRASAVLDAALDGFYGGRDREYWR